jgi:hypothetical protein
MARKPGDKVGLLLRFDETLRRAIARSAKAHNRSMNAEIVQRLMTSFQREEMEAFLARHATDAAERGAERGVRNALHGFFLKFSESLSAAPGQEHKTGELDEALATIIADIVRKHETGVATKIADEWDPEKVVELEPRTTGAPAQVPLKREGEK